MKKLNRIIIFGWVLLIFLNLALSVKGAEENTNTYGITDLVSTEDGKLNYFTYSNEYDPYNPTLNLKLEVEDAFSCGECEDMGGNLYFLDEDGEKEVSIAFDLEYSNKEGYDLKTDEEFLGDEDYWFITIILYVEVGENIFEIDILDAVNEHIDFDLYANKEYLESTELADYIYEESDEVLLNGEEKEKHELKQYLKDSMVIGVFYSKNSDVKIMEISLGAFGIPENNGSFTIALVITATGGSVAVGYGLRKKRLRGSE